MNLNELDLSVSEYRKFTNKEETIDPKEFFPNTVKFVEAIDSLGSRVTITDETIPDLYIPDNLNFMDPDYEATEENLKKDFTLSHSVTAVHAFSGGIPEELREKYGIEEVKDLVLIPLTDTVFEGSTAEEIPSNCLTGLTKEELYRLCDLGIENYAFLMIKYETSYQTIPDSFKVGLLNVIKAGEQELQEAMDFFEQ